MQPNFQLQVRNILHCDLGEMDLTYYDFLAVPASNDDEFEKWQKEVIEAEVEAEKLKHVSASGEFDGVDQERPSTPPEGEEEFTDDDGTVYKWDRNIRAWVPQVSALLPISLRSV